MLKSYSVILFAFLALFLNINAKAQGQGCEVSLKSIAGTYTGDCSKGKASGNGTSEGTDKYTGDFKAGLPEGKGVYQWKNGDTFDGLWAKGLREGRGIMTYRREGKTDSIVPGVWKKDIYAGNYESPYVVYQKSMYAGRVDLRKKQNSTESSIVINTTSATSGPSSVSQGPAKAAAETMPGATTSGTSASISDIVVIRGSYERMTDINSSTRGESKKLLAVTYPFRAIYRIGGQDTEIEIFEPGEWTVTIAMNK